MSCRDVRAGCVVSPIGFSFRPRVWPRRPAPDGTEKLDVDWLIFHQINSHSDVLPSQIDNASFAFYGNKLNGQPQQLSRDKRAVAAVNQYLGDAMGKAYADK